VRTRCRLSERSARRIGLLRIGIGDVRWCVTRSNRARPSAVERDGCQRDCPHIPGGIHDKTRGDAGPGVIYPVGGRSWYSDLYMFRLDLADSVRVRPILLKNSGIWFGEKNPRALESLKFPCAEGREAFDDLRPQIPSVRHASSFPRIFGRISIQPKNRFGPRKEFFNRIGQEPTLVG
jgi:hypothetical protein